MKGAALAGMGFAAIGLVILRLAIMVIAIPLAWALGLYMLAMLAVTAIRGPNRAKG